MTILKINWLARTASLSFLQRRKSISWRHKLVCVEFHKAFCIMYKKHRGICLNSLAYTIHNKFTHYVFYISIISILLINYDVCKGQNCSNTDTLDPLYIENYCELIKKSHPVIRRDDIITVKILATSKHLSDIDSNEFDRWFPQLDSTQREYQKKRINDSVQVALLWSAYYDDGKTEWALFIMSKDELWDVKIDRIHGDSPMLRRYSSPLKKTDVFHFLQSDHFPAAIKEAFKNIQSKKPQPCYVRINTWNKYIQKFTFNTK